MGRLMRKIESARLSLLLRWKAGLEDGTYLDLLPVLFFVLGFVVLLLVLAVRYLVGLLP
jgi:hypothetical protein